MRPDELKAWRQGLGLTQAAAAKIFGVTRVTEQNWEGGSSPLPGWVGHLCRDAERDAKKRDAARGPMYVIYHRKPMPNRIEGPLVESSPEPAPFRSNGEALRFVEEKWGTAEFFDPTIIDAHNEIVWTPRELAEEMSKRRHRQVKRTPEEIAAIHRAIKEIQEQVRKLPVLDPSFTDKDLYDEYGLPK